VEYDFFFSPIARAGTGSGIVLDQDGNILTNYHVIASAENLEVALPDQTKYQARMVGADEQNDIAVIRVLNCSKERLHPVAIGDSSSLKVGQKVLAIGNPFRLQNTLTVGIISSLGRKIRTASNNLVENVIQTDAAINPGNSGGPLLNTAGEMIGINTQIVDATGANVGIGFALPANTVRRVVTDLLRNGGSSALGLALRDTTSRRIWPRRSSFRLRKECWSQESIEEVRQIRRGSVEPAK